MSTGVSSGVYRSRALAWSTAALLLAWVLLALLPERRPAPLDAGAEPASFSAARAVAHLEVIARQPHPVGSVEHDAVRDRLLALAAAPGAEVEVQEAEVFHPSRSRRQTGAAGRVANVVVRLRGRGGGAAILLDAHYDSVFTAPGASDDGVGVAVLLEVERALLAGPPLANDVILLFSDAEEVGLLGAVAFVERHRWARDVALVLNLEARGTGGPAVMFQTSDHSRNLIRQLGRAVPGATASSLAYDVYKRMPNGTNFSVYRAAGWPGYDFAFVEGVTAYHTALDSVANVEPRTVQHLGSSVLALCRHFGGLPLDRAALGSGGNAVYFDLLGRTLVAYPAVWALPLALLVVALALAVAVIGLGHRAFGGAELLLGLLLPGAAVAGSIGAVAGLRRVILALHPSYREMASGELYNGALYAAAFTLLAVAVTTALLAAGCRGRHPLAVVFGALLWWVVLAPLSAVALAGGSYLAAWPTLCALLALAVQVWHWPEIDRDHAPRLRFAALAGLALPVVLLLAPMVALLWVALTTEKGWVVGAVAALSTLLLAPQLELAARSRRWLIPTLAAVACLALLAAGSASSGFDRRHPRPNGACYELDGDRGTARWVSHDHRLDPWTAQLFPDGSAAGGGERARFVAPAPSLDLALPALEVLERQDDGGRQRLRLRLWSPRGAPVLRVSGGEGQRDLQLVEVAGTPVEAAPGDPLRLLFHAPSSEGFEMVVAVPAGGTLRFELEDRSYGLPDLPGLAPRGEAMIAKPFGLSDLTIVRRRVEVPAG